jgi:hypothetical protein
VQRVLVSFCFFACLLDPERFAQSQHHLRLQTVHRIELHPPDLLVSVPQVGHALITIVSVDVSPSLRTFDSCPTPVAAAIAVCINCRLW